ncbi:MAG: ribulose-phosphate 3-epimerase [Candidatus Neomarinimicrobiota bacterium]|nr:MAG: ribulose-phosphate 3-epimerase [Candidatus Neomarinimicrobiota bacterium]
MLLAPSILSADFSDLRTVLRQCRIGGADWVHIDVMDHHFVPNLTVGPVVVRSLRPITDLPLDVHLMVDQPESLLDPFAAAGADAFTFHVEAVRDPLPLVRKIQSAGMKAGLSLKPGTPLEKVIPYLPAIDLLLVMSVEPGFGGQDFLPGARERIQRLREKLDLLPQPPLLSVDGGIKRSNAREVLQAGADVLVVGSGIFQDADPVHAMQSLKAIIPDSVP